MPNVILLGAALAAAPVLAAVAQPAEQPQMPEMVLLPRQLAESVAAWMQTPDATTAIRIYAALAACINDNPIGGAVRRTGPDQCFIVTQALTERARELADLRKQLADIKAGMDAGHPAEKP